MNLFFHHNFSRSMFRILLLSFIVAAISFETAFAEESAKPPQVFTDSLLPGKVRQAGAPMTGTTLESGGVKWAATKGVTVSETGVTTALPGGFHHAIPTVAGTIRLEAEIKGKGSGFTGLALGSGDLSNNFWK